MANTLRALMESVSDPTDFAQPPLRELDTALRCTVCRALFDAPVSLRECGHTFCSVCVRETIAARGECPECRKPATEAQLRANTALERAVLAWKTARDLILELSRAAGDERPAKRRKLNPTSSPSPPASSSPSVPDCPASPSNKDPPKSDYVDCPLCEASVQLDVINAHMDNGCRPLKPKSAVASKGKQKAEWSKLMSGAGKGKGKDKKLEGAERLPKQAYDTLSDKAVRQLLQAHDLPTTGERKALVNRHRRWVILFNANLDRTPKEQHSLAAMRGELRTWEADLHKGPGKVVVGDAVKHEARYKGEFAELVARARPKEKEKGKVDNDGEVDPSEGEEQSPKPQEIIEID